MTASNRMPPPPSQPTKTEIQQTTRPEISAETRQEIVRLSEFYGTRQIALRVGESRKRVRRVLLEEGLSSPRQAEAASKLTRFLEPIRERILQGLTTSRIYREFRELGYSGRRTILAEDVRKLRVEHALGGPKEKVKRRFETDPAREMQANWS